jgi:hypothetical protein
MIGHLSVSYMVEKGHRVVMVMWSRGLTVGLPWES